MIGASLFLGGSVKAEVDYQGIAYLGGGDKIDLNNANIRAYLKVPGFYPSIASKIVVNGPFKSVADVYNIPGTCMCAYLSGCLGIWVYVHIYVMMNC